jgi:heme exporter protein CcmD
VAAVTPGHAFYVWAAYGLAVAVMLAEVAVLVRRGRALRRRDVVSDVARAEEQRG